MKTVKVDLHPDHEERSGEWAEIAERLYEAQKMKKHFASVELQLLSQLKALSEDSSSKGGNFIFTCSYSKGNIDFLSIPQLNGIDLELYRKAEIARWKLTKI